MAIATRRLQDAAAPRVEPGERARAGARRSRLDTVSPAAADSRAAHHRVLDAAVDAGDLGATVAAIAGLTRAPAVLQDPFLAVLTSAPPPAGGSAGTPATVDALALTRSGCPLVRDLLRAGTAPADALPGASPARARLADAGPGPRAATLVELPPSGGTPARLVARITARGEVLGFLVVAAVDRAAYATLEAAAPVVALLLQAEERLCRLLDRDQRELFLDLLAGRSADCLVIQGRRLGHDLEQPHWPLVFRADTADTADAARGGTDPQAPQRLEQLVREAVRDDSPPARPAPVVGVDGDTVVVFLPGHGDPPAAVARRARSLAARRGLAVTAGWGPRCETLDAYGAGVARARWVVDVLAAVPGAAPAGYDDLGIYALLYEKRDRDQLADFADRWLGPLSDHGDLMATLRVLLETGGPSAAATALFVHVSTLKYRLRKIESILGVDLSDPEMCFNLRLAFKIRAVQERLAGRPA
jgi:sugar diacid utilization regulator